MSERFSKQSVLAALETKAARLEEKHGFDENNGTAQLTGPRAGQDAAVDYGRYRAYLDLMAAIEDGSLIRTDV